MRVQPLAALGQGLLVGIDARHLVAAGRGGGGGAGDGVGEAEGRAILGKMVKQRQESARVYEEGGRIDLAERELGEIKVIEEFLPRQLTVAETSAAVDAAVEEIGASSIRDMGKVMGLLKERYTGQMDFGKAGPMVKDQLCSKGGC